MEKLINSIINLTNILNNNNNKGSIKYIQKKHTTININTEKNTLVIIQKITNKKSNLNLQNIKYLIEFKYTPISHTHINKYIENTFINKCINFHTYRIIYLTKTMNKILIILTCENCIFNLKYINKEYKGYIKSIKKII